MVLICPVCSTENRAGAKFCRSCGIELSAAGSRIPPPPSPEREWATTAPAQLRAPTIPAPLEPSPARASFFSRSPAARRSDEHEQTVLMVHDDELPRAPAPPASSPLGLESTWASKPGIEKKGRAKGRRPVPAEPPPRKRVTLLWLGLLVLAMAMIVAGWYGSGTRKAPAAADEAAAPVAAPLPPPAEPSPVPPPLPAPEPPPAAPAEAPPEPEAAPPAAVAPKPAAKPRKQATSTAPSSPSAPEPAAPVAAPAPPPAPAAPAEPQAMCGDRNFIARAQCMAAQCLKPEYKAHAQCEAVRRQQRLEEEKRNPTLMN